MSKLNFFGLVAACLTLFAVNAKAKESIDIGTLLAHTHTNTHLLELKPILNSSEAFKSAGVTFLGGDTSYDRGFGNFKDVGRNFNTGNCGDSSSLFNNKNCTYPRALKQSSHCPFKPGYYRECVCLAQFKIANCPAPKYKSTPECDGLAEKCLCPPTISLTNSSEKCTQYCDGNCISKSCTPLQSETGCQYGTSTVTDNCGGTRTVCKACSLPTCSGISSKPANSSYTTSSCTDCSGTKTINSGWSCNSGYTKSGSSCVKECTPVANETGCLYGTYSCSDGCGGTRTCCAACSKPTCSGISSKPDNSSYTTSSCTDCSGTKTINSGWSCDSGYYKSGSSCVKECTLPTCSGITSKPANSSYKTSSCTDCSGTKTINSGWSCNSGFYKSGSSCVKECTLPTCSGVTTKPANSSYTTSSCTDCSGTKTINSGWSCNSGYTKSGSSCVKECTLPTCSGITTKPANSSYTTSSCTDCSGTKTINTGWTCNSGYTKSGSSCVGSCSAGGYLSTKPSYLACDSINYNGSTCYKNCRRTVNIYEVWPDGTSICGGGPYIAPSHNYTTFPRSECVSGTMNKTSATASLGETIRISTMDHMGHTLCAVSRRAPTYPYSRVSCDRYGECVFTVEDVDSDYMDIYVIYRNTSQSSVLIKGSSTNCDY